MEESDEAETCFESGIRRKPKLGKHILYLKIPLRLMGVGVAISGSD